MGSNPNQVSNDVLQQCIKNWKDQPMIVCIYMEIQAFGKTEAEAQENCQNNLGRRASYETASTLTFLSRWCFISCGFLSTEN